MGWGSATPLFDGVLDLVIEYVPASEQNFVLRSLIDLFEAGDWDTQSDSEHYELIEPVLKQMHPDWDWDDE